MRPLYPVHSLGIIALLAAALMWGCDGGGSTPEKKEDPVTTPLIPFSLMAPFLTVSPEASASVELWGGTTPYAVATISDSSKIYPLQALIGQRGGKWYLNVRGKAKGSTIVTVKDAGGKSLLPVEVRVQSFYVTPSAVTLPIQSATEIRVQSGSRPFVIAVPPSPQIATCSLSDTILFVLAIGPGSTAVVLRDQNGIGDSVSIPLTVVAPLRANTMSVSMMSGMSTVDSISGGTPPYRLYSYDDVKVSALLTGSTVTISANAAASGYATVTIADNSIPRLILPLSVLITQPLTLSKSALSLPAGGSEAVAVSGGLSPYIIKTAPDSSVATAAFNGGSLVVTAAGAGSTSLTIADNSTPVQTKSLSITVTSSGEFTTAGTLAFGYYLGRPDSLYANGIFYNIRAGNSGVGAFSYPGSTSKIIVYAYKDYSPVSADIFSLTITNTGTVTAGDYPFASTASANAAGFYKMNANLNDTSRTGFMMSSGTLSVTAYSGISISGTFSGKAYDILNSVTTMTISNGQFTVPIIIGSTSSAADQKVREVILRSLR